MELALFVATQAIEHPFSCNYGYWFESSGLCIIMLQLGTCVHEALCVRLLDTMSDWRVCDSVLCVD